MGGLRVNVADLTHRPGARRHERVYGSVGEMRVVATMVPGGTEVEVDALLEWVHDGVLASGKVVAGWTSECRRCLRPVTGQTKADFRELFEPRPQDGETYALRHDHIDLAPLARDALLVELPLAPLCQPDCRGLCPSCGADLNAAPCGCAASHGDPRWQALDALKGDITAGD